MIYVLLFKAEHGNPHHDPKTGRFSSGDAPSTSRDIYTEQQAANYWRRHVAGVKIIVTKLAVPFHVLRVDFPRNATHAYTDHVSDDHGRRTRRRKFSEQRAHDIDRIFPTLRAPKIAMQHGDGYLFLERAYRGEHFTVVLKPLEDGVYVFVSAHRLSVRQVSDRLKNATTVLAKTEAPDYSGAPTLSGVSPSGVPASSLWLRPPIEAAVGTLQVVYRRRPRVAIQID